ncbi:MAG: hypothetical protein OXU23_21260, partial [Candidatus Poribacteria bacterium]|nr:hypothetical protein [Candidatus Poribacteria bacterium]
MPGLKGHKMRINSIVYSSDGKTIAGADTSRTIHFWDAQTGESLRKLKGDISKYRSIESFAFSPDGMQLYIGSRWDRGVSVWDLRTNKIVNILATHTSLVNCVAIRPDGSQLASGGWDKNVLLSDTNTHNVA